jgi:hypothetical protein
LKSELESSAHEDSCDSRNNRELEQPLNYHQAQQRRAPFFNQASEQQSVSNTKFYRSSSHEQHTKEDIDYLSMHQKQSTLGFP